MTIAGLMFFLAGFLIFAFVNLIKGFFEVIRGTDSLGMKIFLIFCLAFWVVAVIIGS